MKFSNNDLNMLEMLARNISRLSSGVLETLHTLHCIIINCTWKG